MDRNKFTQKYAIIKANEATFNALTTIDISPDKDPYKRMVIKMISMDVNAS